MNKRSEVISNVFFMMVMIGQTGLQPNFFDSPSVFYNLEIVFEIGLVDVAGIALPKLVSNLTVWHETDHNSVSFYHKRISEVTKFAKPLTVFIVNGPGGTTISTLAIWVVNRTT